MIVLPVLTYVDSLFAERRERLAKPLFEIPDTLAKLYVMAMREHARKSVLLHRAGDRWLDTPDWRLDRQVIRLALFMRERFGLEPRQKVALVAPLGPEWVAADLAILSQGSVSAAIDARWPDDWIAEALQHVKPAVVLLGDAALADRLEQMSPHILPPSVIIWRGGDGSRTTLTEALDLGGTLDTAERANAFRARARALAPEHPALWHAFRDDQGLHWRTLAHRQVIEQLRDLWERDPAHQDDVVYVGDGELTLDRRLALYSLIGDGYSVTAIGPETCSVEELVKLRVTRALASGIPVPPGPPHSQRPSANESPLGWRLALEKCLGALRPRAQGVEKVQGERAR